MKKAAKTKLTLVGEVVKTFSPIEQDRLVRVIGGRPRFTGTNTGCTDADSGCGIRTF